MSIVVVRFVFLACLRLLQEAKEAKREE